MQILTLNNRNFQKPSRNPSNRTKVKSLKKNSLDSSSKKFGSAYTQSPQKCSNIEILAKIEGKEAKFFWTIYEGHIRIWFRSKKNLNYLMLVYLQEFSSWLFTVTSPNGFYPTPPPKPRPNGLKLVCNVNIVYGNLNKIVRSCIRLLVCMEINVTADRLLCMCPK